MEREKFSQFLTDVYTHGSLMLAIGLGHDLGLFQVFYDTGEALSLDDIASKTNLKERYCKEWLSGMVAARILHLDSDTSLYSMPESHKEELKVQASSATFIVHMANRIKLVKNCFRKDGPYGFGYDEDPSYFDWNLGQHGNMDTNLNTVVIPVLNQQGIISKLETGIDALDVGCGEAGITAILAQQFPNTQFTGLENDKYALKIAQEKAKNIPNLTTTGGNAEHLPDSWAEKFDLVFVHDVLHDLANPHKVLDEIYKVLKDDGSLCLVDINIHSNPHENVGDMIANMNYSLSMFICLPSSMAQKPHIGYGLGWGIEEIEKALVGAKFKVSRSDAADKVVFFCTK